MQGSWLWEEESSACNGLWTEEASGHKSHAKQTHGRAKDTKLSVVRSGILQLDARGCHQREDGGRARQSQAAEGEGGCQ